MPRKKHTLEEIVAKPRQVNVLAPLRAALAVGAQFANLGDDT